MIFLTVFYNLFLNNYFGDDGIYSKNPTTVLTKLSHLSISYKCSPILNPF